MSASPFDSLLAGALLGDPEIARLFSADAEIAGMIRAEAALARAQARLGLIPAEAGEALATALAGLSVDPTTLAGGYARDGVAAPALVRALRGELPETLAPWLHWGATSQDIADLSLILRLGEVLARIEGRLGEAIARLVPLAESHRFTPCLARTRTQAAAPTAFGVRVAGWIGPLVRLRARIAEARPRVLAVQLGGAVGNWAAYGAQGSALADALAAELGLSPALPWHTARDRIEEIGGLLVSAASAAARIGADLALLASGDVAELRFEGAGGSSTLPQKQNPVGAEALVALGRHAAGQVGLLHQAAVQPTERDGAGWLLETLALPSLAQSAGRALALLVDLLDALRPDTARMAANLAATRGTVYAEAATFALARALPRAEAQERVAAALRATMFAPALPAARRRASSLPPISSPTACLPARSR